MLLVVEEEEAQTLSFLKNSWFLYVDFVIDEFAGRLETGSLKIKHLLCMMKLITEF